jgi:luciferase family oxidoreductase group 1
MTDNTRARPDMVQMSVLDLSPITQGGTVAQSLRHSLDLARHAERWGYARDWLAEHHNVEAVASAATSVVIAHVAGGTSTIRVGAGGIMLPNHSPLVIAEQFGTLESLFPGRIDPGLGRAPGSNQITAIALRRNASVDTFPQDVAELLAYFREPVPGQKVKAVPGAGLHVPVWILGSSLFGAQLAAEVGSVRLRVALRAGADAGGDSRLPEPTPTLRVLRSVSPHAGAQRRRRRLRP